ncbi:MAG: cytidine deaminase [Chloroflexota bacterium]
MRESEKGIRLDLIEKARAAASKAYAPYSGYRVGSALSCVGDGQLFTGCNVENASYGVSLCAERAAAVAAVSAGRRDFEILAVYAEGPELPFPCGACRQFLSEFNRELMIIVSNGNDVESFILSDLLPHTFGGDHIQGRATAPPLRRGGEH